jgi:DNA (cytosine-5)-methyltransferase 1
MLESHELIVDLFAGGGGASAGIRDALGRDPDIAINHDPVAIAMHEANHPGTRHFCQDIWEVPPKWATRSQPVGLLWASPDCRHHSKAKGSAPKRSRKIRSLAWVVEKWIIGTRPRIVILENVEEFKHWGPLNDEGKIIKTHKGDTFRAYIRMFRRYGYRVEYQELRACDYGAPTIRKRLFMIARCDGLPIIWPEPTHGPGLIPYRTAAEIIDWSIPCPSIFERKKPLVDNTLRRIAEGIRRYVIEADEPFIVPQESSGLVVPHIQRQFGKSIGSGADDPVGTVTACGSGKTAIVTAFLTEHANAKWKRNFDASEPLRTQCAQVKGGHFALVAAHIAQHNGGFYDGAGRSMKDALSTITSRGTQQQLVTSNLIKFRGTCRHGQAVTDSMPTITAGGTHIGEVRAFLLKYYGTDQDPKLREPLHTLTTRDRFGLVSVTINGEPYVITDIGMRMLQPHELFRAQGFDDSYKTNIQVNGKRITKTDQVRCCGNSVCPPLARVLVKANLKGGINQWTTTK